MAREGPASFILAKWVSRKHYLSKQNGVKSIRKLEIGDLKLSQKGAFFRDSRRFCFQLDDGETVSSSGGLRADRSVADAIYEHLNKKSRGNGKAKKL
jgi:hypothetical protein